MLPIGLGAADAGRGIRVSPFSGRLCRIARGGAQSARRRGLDRNDRDALHSGRSRRAKRNRKSADRSNPFRATGLFLDSRGKLPSQLFLVGKIQLVSADEDAVRDSLRGELDDKIVLPSPEDDADRRGVAFRSLFGAEVIQVHVHLSDIAVFDHVPFQVDENETLQKIVVENEIDVTRTRRIEGDAVFARDERKALAKLEQEVLHVFEKRPMQGRFPEPTSLPEPREFHDVAVAENVGGLLNFVALVCEFENALLVLRKSQPLEKRRPDLATQFPDVPVRAGAFRAVEADGEVVGTLQDFQVVAPTQFARQCRAFREVTVQLAHVLQVVPIETPSVGERQIPCKDGKERTAVSGPVSAVLFVFDDVASRIPIRFNEGHVRHRRDFRSGLRDQFANGTDQARVSPSRFDFGNDGFGRRNGFRQL